jgi:hypothetical protein
MRLAGQLTRFDADFNILPDYLQDEGQVEVLPSITDDTKFRLRNCAVAIGRQFPFAGVDFLLDENQGIFLGEVTFSPLNALARRPKEIDISLGKMRILQITSARFLERVEGSAPPHLTSCMVVIMGYSVVGAALVIGVSSNEN